MDSWVERIHVLLALDREWDKNLYPMMTSSLYLLAGRHFPDQTVENDIEIREGRSPGLFVLVSASMNTGSLVCPASHNYMLYSVDEKRKLVEVLHLEEVAIPALPIFVVYWYPEQGRRRWRGSRSLLYHNCVISLTYNRKDTVLLPYGVYFAEIKTRATDSGERQ